MTPDSLRAPYAPPATVLAVIRRMHDRGLPEIIDESALAVSEVPDSLHARTLTALRFLGLVDEKARRTDLFTRLGKATTEDYAPLLAEIVRDAYAPVFEAGIDPAQDNDKRIMDAFRRYEPSGQRESMARLFRGLCQEAGLAPAGAAAEPRTQRARQPQGRQSRSQTPRGPKLASMVPTVTASLTDGRTDLRPIHQIVDALPAEGWWTADLRKRWLRMLEGALDYAIDVREAAPPREVADQSES